MHFEAAFFYRNWLTKQFSSNKQIKHKQFYICPERHDKPVFYQVSDFAKMLFVRFLNIMPNDLGSVYPYPYYAHLHFSACVLCFYLYNLKHSSNSILRFNNFENGICASFKLIFKYMSRNGSCRFVHIY